MSLWSEYKYDYAFHDYQSIQKEKSMTTSNTTNETTNSIIKDVQVYWVKIAEAVSPFGVPQYECTIQVPKKRIKELEAFGKVKDGFDAGTVKVSLKKKALKADGTDAAKVRCVDAFKNPLDPKTIGNGSTGNIMVMQRPYQIKLPNGKISKEGITTALSAIQITKLIKYEAKNDNFVDFDSEEGSSVAATPEDSDF
jgi:hypothetical protein